MQDLELGGGGGGGGGGGAHRAECSRLCRHCFLATILVMTVTKVSYWHLFTTTVFFRPSQFI